MLGVSGFADFNSILTRCKNYLCQLLNVHGVKNFRLTDIYIYIYICVCVCVYVYFSARPDRIWGPPSLL